METIQAIITQWLQGEITAEEALMSISNIVNLELGHGGGEVR